MQPLRRDARGRRARAARATSDVAGGPPERQRRRPRAGSSPATPGPQRDLAVLNAGAAIYAAGRADDLASGRPRRRGGDRLAAPPPSALDRLVALTARAGAELDERARAHRRRDARRGRAAGATTSRSPSSSARSIDAPRGPRPFPEALARPGISRDRRAQAPLAVGRADPRGRHASSEIVQRLRARRRRGAVDPHRGAALRRLARRPARGARGDAACRSCARTSSSTPTSSTSRRPPAPTRSC